MSRLQFLAAAVFATLALLARPGTPAAAGLAPEPVRAPLRTLVETEHFCIQTDAPPGDPYADSVAAACEHAWRVLHQEQNWDLPPVGGGSGCPDKVSGYITDLPEGVLEFVEPENFVPGDPPYDMTASFYIDDAIPYGCLLRGAVDHAYFHVIEYGYYGLANLPWFMQQCSGMAEEWVDDACNDYRLDLPSFFSRPYAPFMATEAIVWPMYLSERFGPALVESVWDRLQWTGDVFASHDEALAPYGYDMGAAYLELMRWCFYTGARDDGRHFEEAGAWQAMLMPDRTFSDYPTGDQHPSSTRRPQGLGTSVMRFDPDPGSPDAPLCVQFDGPDCTLGVQFIVAKPGSADCDEYVMQLDPSGNGMIRIPDFHATAAYAFMLVSMSRACGGVGQDYVFWADTGPSAIPPEEAPTAGTGLTLSCAPTPSPSAFELRYCLPAAGAIELRILSADGRCLRLLQNGWQAAGLHAVPWDGLDASGRPAGSGVYWAVLRAGAETLARRIVRTP